MKSILIFLSMLILMLIIQTEITKKGYIKEDYLKKSDVEKSLLSSDVQDKKDLERDESYQKRLENLTPLKELFEGNRGMRREEKEEVIIDLPDSVDLRDYTSDIREQWNGTCSAFGLIATEEVAHCKQRGECGLDLSERHFWSFYKKYSAPIALEMSTNYVAKENYWPQTQISRPTDLDKYSDYAVESYEYLGGDSEKAKQKVLSALAQGRPVYMWSQTPSCMLSCRATCNATSNGFEDGGHAYAVVGYFNASNPTLIIKNSWGKDCGDKGFQYMSFEIWDNSSYWEAASIVSVYKKGDAPNNPDIPKDEYITKCEYRWSYKHFWTKRKYCWTEKV